MTGYVWLVKNKSLAGASRAIPSMQYYSILLSYVNYGIGVKQADIKKKKRDVKKWGLRRPWTSVPRADVEQKEPDVCQCGHDHS